MHVLFVTAVASLVIYINFTKCKANYIFVMHCINKPRAKIKLRLHYLYLVMPPFEEKGVYCFAHVSLSVGLSVGRSVHQVVSG